MQAQLLCPLSALWLAVGFIAQMARLFAASSE
jgi:hypothetical protein